MTHSSPALTRNFSGAFPEKAAFVLSIAVPGDVRAPVSISLNCGGAQLIRFFVLHVVVETVSKAAHRSD